MDILGTGGSIWNIDDFLSGNRDEPGSVVVSETILQGSSISVDNEFQMEKKQGQERE